tara:strand:+ start:311 stop:493 length:183 start_codon:yes stop_codon:yes gene_type:complete
MKLTPSKLIKNVTITYFAFGVGIIVGSLIAATMAGLMLRATLSLEQIEIMNEVAEDFKED